MSLTTKGNGAPIKGGGSRDQVLPAARIARLNLEGEPSYPEGISVPSVSVPVPSPAKLPWLRRLGTRALLTLFFVFIGIVLGLVAIIQTYGRDLVFEESLKRIEASGNLRVGELHARLSEIAALTRSLGASSATLPAMEESFKTTLPAMIDFGGDPGVAGGGYWPEPGAFSPGIDRRSFFWARDSAGDNKLKYLDDYNAPPPARGYHNDEWYVTVRHKPPGSVFWSRSYVDPYSLEPMVTCTGNVFRDGEFNGVVTIDLKL